MKLRQMAFDRDPRIKAETVRENEAKAAVKLAKKLEKEKKWKESQVDVEAEK